MWITFHRHEKNVFKRRFFISHKDFTESTGFHRLADQYNLRPRVEELYYQQIKQDFRQTLISN